MGMVRSVLRSWLSKLLRVSGQDYVRYEGLILPPKLYRFCGAKARDNRSFLHSAKGEAQQLERHCSLSTNSKILDVGCGPGRLAIGILQTLGGVEQYWGIDVDEVSIDWCQRYITSNNSAFRFAHLDFENERYNPQGKIVDDNFSFPVGDQKFDIIYLYSVFSHMLEDGTRIYLNKLCDLLSSGGNLFCTAFVEDDVDSVSVNPENYAKNWKGPLHCVRYNKGYFLSILEGAGFKVENLIYGNAALGQSSFYLEKNSLQ